MAAPGNSTASEGPDRTPKDRQGAQEKLSPCYCTWRDCQCDPSIIEAVERLMAVEDSRATLTVTK